MFVSRDVIVALEGEKRKGARKNEERKRRPRNGQCWEAPAAVGHSCVRQGSEVQQVQKLTGGLRGGASKQKMIRARAALIQGASSGQTRRTRVKSKIGKPG